MFYRILSDLMSVAQLISDDLRFHLGSTFIHRPFSAEMINIHQFDDVSQGTPRSLNRLKKSYNLSRQKLARTTAIVPNGNTNCSPTHGIICPERSLYSHKFVSASQIIVLRYSDRSILRNQTVQLKFRYLAFGIQIEKVIFLILGLFCSSKVTIYCFWLWESNYIVIWCFSS